MTQSTLHSAQNTACHERPESITDNIAAVENSCAYSQLLLCIPFRKQKQSTWKECGLDKTKEKPGKECANEAK